MKSIGDIDGKRLSGCCLTGPTLAFKDLGLQILGQLLQYFLAQDRQNLLVLVGTSGDTGSAAIEAVKGLNNVDIMVLYPLKEYANISLVQELQMTSCNTERNVDVLAVEGTSDDLDVPMEILFRDAEYKREHRLGSINSVNIARVLAQVVHYFYSFLRVCPAAAGMASFFVPTGAAGHISAGVLAVQMGLPAERLCAATNENDIMHQFISTGTLQKSGAVAQTNSPSMDIQVPYNIERLMYIMTAGNSRQVIAWMNEFKSTGRLRLSWEEMRPLRDLGLTSAMATSSRVLEVISAVQCCGGYMLDPHTAVGVAAFLDMPQAQGPSVCMACAHPVKFAETVAAAFQVSVDVANHMMPDADHPGVSRVFQLLRDHGTMSLGGLPCQVLRRGEDWAMSLRKLIAMIEARRLQPKM